jgi:trans-2,3-dihydro-3-hydroxyanthranilic acid synthase
MAAPVVEPYIMPGVAEIPANRASWLVDARRAALLVHDMQKYFVRPFRRSATPHDELMSNVRRLRDACHDLDVPVVYTAQLGGMAPADRGLLRDFWGAGMSAAAEDRDIADEVAPASRDTVIAKWRYSAFHRSPLLTILQDHGRDQLILCGVYAHLGVLLTAFDAFSHDIQPFLVGDAVADLTRQDHALALTYAARGCACVTWTSSLVAELASPAAEPRIASTR